MNKFNFYKLCVEEARNISERRMKNNQYFTILHSALLSFIATLYCQASFGIRELLALLVLSLLGVFLCGFWKRSINSYKKLNSAKFKVICAMEKNPDFEKCFTDEWEILKHDKEYSILSSHEISVTNVFLYGYTVSLLASLILTLLSFRPYICS